MEIVEFAEVVAMIVTTKRLEEVEFIANDVGNKYGAYLAPARLYGPKFS